MLLAAVILNLPVLMPSSLSLSISGLLPLPLRERLSARDSAIWQKEIAWNSGKRIFVQAPSGTGKTTLIHILYGLRNDFDGHVRWGEQNMVNASPELIASLRRNAISVIYQDMRLFPALTTWENLEIKRVLTDTISVDEVKVWMQRLGISDRADRLASTLSYGEQQRTAIIRALLQPFNWLLMDEPFSHLDIANTKLAAELISEVVERNGASFILADLDDNAHFSYTEKLKL